MDFNGVIIDDELVQMRAYQEILSGEGIDLTEADYFASLGMDDRTFVEAAWKRAGKTVEPSKVEDIVQAKSAKWREMVSNDLPMFDGIENFIKKMAAEFTLGVVSMAGREEIEFVLEKSGLAGCFAKIVSAEDVSICKPDPECFRTGFRQIDAFRTSHGHLPMTHRECLVIEDSPPGIVAARNADLPSLGITNTVSAEELRSAGADAVSSRLDDWMPDSIRRVFV